MTVRALDSQRSVADEGDVFLGLCFVASATGRPIVRTVQGEPRISHVVEGQVLPTVHSMTAIASPDPIGLVELVEVRVTMARGALGRCSRHTQHCLHAVSRSALVAARARGLGVLADERKFGHRMIEVDLSPTGQAVAGLAPSGRQICIDLTCMRISVTVRASRRIEPKLNRLLR